MVHLLLTTGVSVSILSRIKCDPLGLKTAGHRNVNKKTCHKFLSCGFCRLQVSVARGLERGRGWWRRWRRTRRKSPTPPPPRPPSRPWSRWGCGRPERRSGRGSGRRPPRLWRRTDTSWGKAPSRPSAGGLRHGWNWHTLTWFSSFQTSSQLSVPLLGWQLPSSLARLPLRPAQEVRPRGRPRHGRLHGGAL